MAVPSNPKIYHITHRKNLASIITNGSLYSDARMVRECRGFTNVGMSNLKLRRLEELGVGCHPGSMVGDFVPFYFCPRSVMLYILHAGNHQELAYKGGQEPIVHLEADLHTVVNWADAQKPAVKWAFSLSNAAARYTEFRDNLAQLNEINWKAIGANDFRSPNVKEGKQAEFLLHDCFPWHLVERIGVLNFAQETFVTSVISSSCHQPLVQILPQWYY